MWCVYVLISDKKQFHSHWTVIGFQGLFWQYVNRLKPWPALQGLACTPVSGFGGVWISIGWAVEVSLPIGQFSAGHWVLRCSFIPRPSVKSVQRLYQCTTQTDISHLVCWSSLLVCQRVPWFKCENDCHCFSLLACVLNFWT